MTPVSILANRHRNSDGSLKTKPQRHSVSFVVPEVEPTEDQPSKWTDYGQISTTIPSKDMIFNNICQISHSAEVESALDTLLASARLAFD